MVVLYASKALDYNVRPWKIQILASKGRELMHKESLYYDRDSARK